VGRVAEVNASARRRAEYSTDASLYRVPPELVVFPRDLEEAEAAVVVTCLEVGVPVTARGAGASIAGNAVGPGVVVDLGRHLGRVLALDPEAAMATVEPGVVLDDLQAAARPHGLRFGPDPSTHSRCTSGDARQQRLRVAGPGRRPHPTTSWSWTGSTPRSVVSGLAVWWSGESAMSPHSGAAAAAGSW
jgi:hypothetical protein